MKRLQVLMLALSLSLSALSPAAPVLAAETETVTEIQAEPVPEIEEVPQAELPAEEEQEEAEIPAEEPDGTEPETAAPEDADSSVPETDVLTETDESLSDGAPSYEAEDSDAETDAWIQDYSYSIEGGSVVLSSYRYDGNPEPYVPAQVRIDGQTYLTRVSHGSIWSYTNISSITFESGVSFSGNLSKLFKGCDSLTSIDFGGADFSKVTNLDDAFLYCDCLESIHVPVHNQARSILPIPFVDEKGKACHTLPCSDCSFKIRAAIPLEKMDSISSIVSGTTVNLITSVYPKNADTDLEFSFEDSYYCSNHLFALTADGKLTAPDVKKHTGLMTGAIDPPSCSIFVRDSVSEKCFYYDVGMSFRFTMNAGDRLTLDYPWQHDYDSYKVKSSNTKVVKFDSQDRLCAVGAGTATITFSDEGETISTATVTVKNVPLKGVSLPASTTVSTNNTVTLKPSFSPSNATNKGVTWKSSNTKIATVDKNGKVKGIKAGSCTITCTTKEGKKKASTKVTVKYVKVKSVKITAPSKKVTKGKTLKLTPAFTPANASNKGVTWKTSNKKIATVSSSGVVTGKKKGTVTITCTTKEGKKKATFKVTVRDNVYCGKDVNAVKKMSWEYNEIVYAVNRLYYKNGKLHVRLAAWNYDSDHARYFEWISLEFKDKKTGKVIASHTFYNYNLNMKPWATKYLDFDIPAKDVKIKNFDLAAGGWVMEDDYYWWWD